MPKPFVFLVFRHSGLLKRGPFPDPTFVEGLIFSGLAYQNGIGRKWEGIGFNKTPPPSIHEISGRPAGLGVTIQGRNGVKMYPKWDKMNPQGPRFLSQTNCSLCFRESGLPGRAPFLGHLLIHFRVRRLVRKYAHPLMIHEISGQPADHGRYLLTYF